MTIDRCATHAFPPFVAAFAVACVCGSVVGCTTAPPKTSAERPTAASTAKKPIEIGPGMGYTPGLGPEPPDPAGAPPKSPEPPPNVIVLKRPDPPVPIEPFYVATARYQELLLSPLRTERDRSMDGARNPVEFLLFAQVRQGMQVLDLSAGAGYTSQLLALAVGPKGRVWAQREQPGEALTQRLKDHPQPNLIPVYRTFEDPVPPDAPMLDLITLVLNYHDIAYLPVDRAKMNKRLFDALKPGGHFVVIDHSALPGTGTTVAKSLHRIEEIVVIDEVRAAGFALENTSKFLRNPADSRADVSNKPAVPTDKFALRFVKHAE